MHVSIPNETRHKRQDGDDHNRGCAGDPRFIPFAHRSERQSAGDGIDRVPPDARDHVQDDWDAVWEVEGEGESGKCQLSEAEFWTERGEIGDGDGEEEVEEDDGEDRGPELETKRGSAEGPERERWYRRVGGEP